MTEQELNKKLAEWAGVEEQKVYVPDPMDYPDHKLILARSSYPDFTHSLDACFKWLVPKAREELTQDRLYLVLYNWISSIGYFDGDSESALALCKTIEKLIDSKGKEN